MSNTDTPETKAPTSGSIDKLRRWRDEYRASLMASPLEDVNQLSAKLDLTHAHPSGISQLFASADIRYAAFLNKLLCTKNEIFSSTVFLNSKYSLPKAHTSCW